MNKNHKSGLAAYAIDSSSSLLKHIALKLGADGFFSGRDLSRVAIVFEGKRPSLFLNKYLVDNFQGSFIPPVYFTRDSWFDALLSKSSSLRKALDMNASYFVYTLIREMNSDLLKGYESFADFLPWAREIVQVVDDLDIELISNDSLTAITEHAEVGFDLPDAINRILVDIVKIRNTYHKRLLDSGVATKGLRRYLAAESISDIELRDFDKIIIVNCLYLSASETHIIREISKKTNVECIYHNTMAESNVVMDSVKSLGAELTTYSGATCTQPSAPKVDLYAAADLHAQVSIATTLLNDLSWTTDTVLVLPDEEAIIPLLSSLQADPENLNVSMGYSLARATVTDLLQLIIRAQLSSNNGQFYSKDYLELLSHPLVKNYLHNESSLIARVLVHKIEELLLGAITDSLNGALFVDIEDIENSDILITEVIATCRRAEGCEVTHDEVVNVLKDIHFAVIRKWMVFETFYDFSETVELFCDFLLNKTFVKNYPVNLSVIKVLYGFIDEYKSSLFSNEVFKASDIFRIFDGHLKSQKTSFSGTPLKGIQILGALETRDLQFKNIIFMGMNEGIIPQIKKTSSLIPRDIMRSLGCRSLRVDEDIQSYRFFSLLAGAEKVSLVYEESDKSEPSRYIQKLLLTKTCNLDVNSTVRKSFFIGGGYKRENLISKSDDVLRFLSKDFTYSVSSLNTYINCPRRFYYEYVLRFREKENIAEEPKATEIGTFLHEVLEDVYGQFLNKKPVIDESFLKKAERIFDERFESDLSIKLRSDAKYVKAVMKNRLALFYEKERSREIASVAGLEKEYRLSLPWNKGEVAFVAKIDRVDYLSDDSYLVIDYKTGGKTGVPAKLKKLLELDVNDRQSVKKYIQSFQLPLYVECLKANENKHKVDAALFYIKTGASSYLSHSTGEEPPFEEGLKIYKKAVSAMLNEILNSSIDFSRTPEEGSCVYCPFRALCE